MVAGVAWEDRCSGHAELLDKSHEHHTSCGIYKNFIHEHSDNYHSFKYCNYTDYSYNCIDSAAACNSRSLV